MSDLDALQTALAAEHAAVYVYGVLGGRVADSRAAALRTAIADAYTTHRGRRDVLERRVSDLNTTPVAAAASYEVPGPLTSPAQVRAAALGVERACTRTYAAVVTGTDHDLRRWAVGALRDAALRELAFGGSPQTLPGLPALPSATPE